MESIITDNVKRIIKERGLKQRFISEKAGYNEKIFSSMLNKRKKITDVDVLAIANALEVEPNALFETNKANQCDK